MAVESAPVPFGLDPLVAEARRRMRRRRALGLAVVVAAIGASVGTFFALRGPSAQSSHTNRALGPAPLVFGGSSFSAPQKSMGDHTTASQQTTLACVNRRHYMDGVALQNRSHRPLTLLDVQWRSPAPAVVQLVATQFRVSPRGIQSRSFDWSGVPTGAVTVPPNRFVSVEYDFLFRNCGQLAGGHEVAVPGSAVIRYRSAGVVRQKLISAPPTAFVLAAAPTRTHH